MRAKSPNECIRSWRNRTTIRKQLSLWTGLIVAFVMALLITFNYITQRKANIDQQISTQERLLALEVAQLDDYVAQLRTYALQFRSDSDFMDLAATKTPLDYERRQIVESAIKNSFYAREDVLELEVYLVQQELKYKIDRTHRKVNLYENALPTELDDYGLFITKPDFFSMTADDNGFLCITRPILNIPYDTLLAVVRFTVNDDVPDALTLSHLSAQEELCILGTDGETYTLPDGMTAADADALLNNLSQGAPQFIYNGLLCVANSDSRYGFIVLSIKPVTAVNAALIATTRGSILLGLAALAVTLVVVLTSIRLIVGPLSTLAHRLRRIGTGNFKTRTQLEGSMELIGLSEDVNQMISGIDRLIEINYIAKLNERTAQLIALEAQTNPHFLFNTLQAISAKAIVNGQDEIYRMVSSLAALLRYSVKDGNIATLETELEDVGKYLLLQKARFGERLEYSIHADEALLPLNFPKLGLLSLVENSIVHGISKEVQSLKIELSCVADGENVRCTVRDNGSGIGPEKLSELRAEIANPNISISRNIGLVNLASRLKLLYNGKEQLVIESCAGQARETRILLIIPKEVLADVQDPDR